MPPFVHRFPAATESFAGLVASDIVADGVREAKQRRAAAEVAGEARCPCCRMLLVARMGRNGPWFPCRCREG